jgi:hypothetical protein
LLSKFPGEAIVELDRLMTAGTDQVVVTATGHQDVVGCTRPLVNRAQEAQFTEQIQRTVNRHSPDPRRNFPDAFHQLIRSNMTLASDECLEDGFARLSQAEALIHKSLLKAFVKTVHPLPGPSPQTSLSGRKEEHHKEDQSRNQHNRSPRSNIEVVGSVETHHSGCSANDRSYHHHPW